MKVEAVDAGDKIDTVGRHAELNDHTWAFEVRQRELLHGRAEAIERVVDARWVVAFGIDPDVQIFVNRGSAWTAIA